MQNNKDLFVWEKTHRFTLRIYEITKVFPGADLYCLTYPLRKAATTIPANSTEGYGNNTELDFLNFLTIALGSTYESENYLVPAKQMNCSKQ